MTAFVIVSLFLWMVCIFCSIGIGKHTSDGIGVAIGILLSTLIIGLIALYSNKDYDQPQAIDVYRGNTTLEITYRDTIPVDSVVVFKNR